jgi:hypothetical protein
MNKTDMLWDELQGEPGTQQAIERTRGYSANHLGIQPQDVIPRRQLQLTAAAFTLKRLRAVSLWRIRISRFQPGSHRANARSTARRFCWACYPANLPF